MSMVQENGFADLRERIDFWESTLDGSYAQLREPGQAADQEGCQDEQEEDHHQADQQGEKS